MTRTERFFALATVLVALLVVFVENMKHLGPRECRIREDDKKVSAFTPVKKLSRSAFIQSWR